MAKILVIDGLARSGTTLISSIIHSQIHSACYRGIFHEFLACNIGRWPFDYVNYPITEQGVVIDKSLFSWFKAQLNWTSRTSEDKPLKLNYDSFTKHALSTLSRKEQFDKLTYQQWVSFLNENQPSDLHELDLLYQNLAKKMDVELLAFRWNQGIPYMNKWLRKPEHFWLSVVRNPMDRALSAKKAFNWSYDESVKATSEYSKKLTDVLDLPNHHVIYFEDLISNPVKVIAELYEFMGLSLSEINLDLVQQSGQPYLVETSDLVMEGKKHTHGREFSGFDKKMIGKYRSEMMERDLIKFDGIFDEFNVLSRYKINEGRVE